MTVIYEDAAIIARHEQKSAAVGHVQITPEKNVHQLFELLPQEVVQMFFAGSFTANILFDGLGAQGTNLLLLEGKGEPTLHVLPRKQEDSLGLMWEPKRADPSDLERVAGKIEEQFWYIGKEAPKEKGPKEVEEVEEVQVSDDDFDYRIEHLKRRL